jgi:PAS domain S-box-containing protein
VSPVAISITSLEDGRLLDANAAYWKLMGYDPATSIGRTTLDLGIWSTENERAQFVSKLKQRRSLKNPAYEFKSLSGETRITLAFYELVQWKNQGTILSMFYDVTEQRQAQLALQTSEEKYRTFVEQSIAGIWLLRFDQPISIDLPGDEQARCIVEFGRLEECNDALVRMYGHSSREEMLGKPWFHTDSEQTRNESLQTALHFIQSGYRIRNLESKSCSTAGQ